MAEEGQDANLPTGEAPGGQAEADEAELEIEVEAGDGGAHATQDVPEGAAQPGGNADEEGEQSKSTEGDASKPPPSAASAAPAQQAASPHEPAQPVPEPSQEPSQEPSAPPSELASKQDSSVTAAQAETVLAALQGGGGGGGVTVKVEEDAKPSESSGDGSAPAAAAAAAAALPPPAAAPPVQDEWVAPSAPLPSLSQYSAKGKEAHVRVERNKYDLEAWKLLVGEVQAGGPMKHLFAEVFERLLAVFPTSGRHWLLYAQGFLADNKKKEALEVLRRGLPACPQVDLWRAYLQHFVGTTSDPELIRKEYEKAADAVGQDIGSNGIWSDYIAFLRNIKVANQYEKGQRMHQLRLAYHVPMHAVDRVWGEYEAWERALDPNNAQQADHLVRETEPKHKAARAAYKERKKLRDAVHHGLLPGPYAGDSKDRAALKAWKDLIMFERSNPQKMPPEDLRRRVEFTFQQCLSFLPLYPEIWFQCSEWHAEMGDAAGELRTLERGIATLPNALLLHLALADKLEVRGKVAQAKQVYENLCEQQPSPLLFIHYMRFARRSESVAAARSVFKRARKSTQGCSWQVFCDAALREYRINKDANIARNIFEAGLKQYATEVPFILQYLEFLSSFNDDNNTRVVFEKVLSDDSGLDRHQALEIWNRFVDFEYSRGDLSAIHKVEKRRAQMFPELPSAAGLGQLATRFHFADLWPCDPHQLDLLGLPEDGPPPGARREQGRGDTDEDRARGGGGEREHGGGGGGERGGGKAKEHAPDPKRPQVPLPPIPPVVQDLLDQLPKGPIQMPPSPEEVLTMLQHMIVPGRFYKPPSTMTVGPGSLIPGTAMPHGEGGLKRGRGHDGMDDDGPGAPPGNDMFRMRQKQRFANITD